MKPIQGIKVLASKDKDYDKMYLVKNTQVEKISNDGKIAVGLFPNSSFVKPDSFKIYNFDNLFSYALQKDKPLIGIIEWPYFGAKGENIYEIPIEVVDKVASSGGIPFGIFPTQVCDFQHTRLADMPELTYKEKIDLEDVLSFCDGVIKPGTLKTYEFDKYIHHYTLVKDMPYLGICGGMQLMTYPMGILKNTNPNLDVKNINLHAGGKGLVHDIKIEKESKLYQIFNKEVIRVNSLHKKCLPDSALVDAKVAALAIDPEYPEERVIEAIEIPDKTYQIGVQWHPETLDDENSKKLFDSFIDEASNYKSRKM